jgi:hypothetical protein
MANERSPATSGGSYMFILCLSPEVGAPSVSEGDFLPSVLLSDPLDLRRVMAAMPGIVT